jgi:hypothetical protein
MPRDGITRCENATGHNAPAVGGGSAIPATAIALGVAQADPYLGERGRLGRVAAG